MTLRSTGIILGLGMLLVPPAQGEPHFAVQEGLQCMVCHVNPGGGGMRTEFGNQWAQTKLAARQLDTGADPWTGILNHYVAVGGNMRANAAYTDIPNQEETFEFEFQEMRLYLDVSPVPGRVGFYLDQRMGPGGSTNREAYGRYWSEDRSWYLKAGQMYLPYGLRLEDDTAFIRQTPGINFDTPDRGMELGWESAYWSAQVAVSNGTAGGPELDRGKQYSLRAEHIQPAWRTGASVNVNDTEIGTRHMQNVFIGLRTGPVAWLAEIDHISDDTFVDGRRTQWVGLLEANWRLRQGQNVKLTAEFLDPDNNVSSDEQNRVSLVWEYAPFQFVQLRLGARFYDGMAQDDLQNRALLFMQAHSYF